MPENTLPEGYKRLALTTGSRMWLDPDELMVVYALPNASATSYDVQFQTHSGAEGSTEWKTIAASELEHAAASFCRQLAKALSA